MDKKDKILIAIAPLALGAVGLMFFGKDLKSEEVRPQENFTSIEAPVTEIRKKRTEIYRDKYEKENAEKFKRKIENDDLFFADEIKEDTSESSLIPEPPPQAPSTNAEEVSIVKTDQKVNKKLKPKVNTKYIERSTPKSDSLQKPEQTTTVKSVRRAGFVSGSSKSTEVANESEGTDEVTIPVVIQESVDAKSGSNVQLRTLEEVNINGATVPKNTLVTGVVSFSQERVEIKVANLKGVSRTVSMKLTGYDLDGNAGIPVEGGVDKEIKKDVVGSVIQETGKVVKVPILNRLPTSAGNKKINDPVVPIPKGYKFYLKQEPK